MKKRTLVPIWVSIAAVWFGMHAGGGFASGQQEVRYFLQAGWTAIFMPFIAMGILGVVNYYVWNYSRLTKSYDFRTWVDKFFYPYDKVFANILDVLFILFLCLPSGAAIAGAASLLNVEFGINYVVSTFISCGILFFCSIYGSELVRNTSTFMTFFLLVSLAVIITIGVYFGFESSAEIIKNKVMTPPTLPIYEGEKLVKAGQTFGYGFAFKMALLYAAFQASIGPLIAVAEPLENKRDVLKTVLFGVLVNGGSLVLICWLLLGFYPAVLSKEIPIPVLYVIGELNMPILKVFYGITLFFAFITTGLAFVYASVRRFENSRVWNGCKENSIFNTKKQYRAIVISILTMLYALAVSQFGLVKIVGKGYQFMGWGYLIFIIIPVLLFGRYKCKLAEQGQY